MFFAVSFLAAAEAGSNFCQSCCSLQYKSHGCYADQEDHRNLPTLVLHEHQIDWNNWKTSMYERICRCGYAAREKGARFFAIQFWAECWISEPGVDWTPPGPKVDKCEDENFQRCGPKDKFCVGTQLTNFVYELVDPPCQVNITYKGCWSDKRRDRALTSYSLTGRQSGTRIDAQSGRIDWRNYDTWLQQFACECAAKAQSLGEKYFGLQFWGECWIGGNAFDKHGENPNGCSSNCFEECDEDSRICVGRNWQNAVYEIGASGPTV